MDGRGGHILVIWFVALICIRILFRQSRCNDVNINVALITITITIISVTAIITIHTIAAMEQTLGFDMPHSVSYTSLWGCLQVYDGLCRRRRLRAWRWGMTCLSASNQTGKRSKQHQHKQQQDGAKAIPKKQT
jgi:hypothetical protein